MNSISSSNHAIGQPLKLEQVGTLLVAEDDAFTRAVLQEILAADNYHVIEAVDGRDALSKATSASVVDVIISDINMPKMSGLELIRTLKQQGLQIPVIILTGNNDVTMAAEALRAGACGYLMKDENIEETVVFSVRQILEKERLHKENVALNKKLADVEGQRDKLEQEIVGWQSRGEQWRQFVLETERRATFAFLISGWVHRAHVQLENTVCLAAQLLQEGRQILVDFERNAMNHKELQNLLLLVWQAGLEINLASEPLGTQIATIIDLAETPFTSPPTSFGLHAFFKKIMPFLDPSLKRAHLSLEWHCALDVEVNLAQGPFFHMIMQFVMYSLKNKDTRETYYPIQINCTMKEGHLTILYQDANLSISSEQMAKSCKGLSEGNVLPDMGIELFVAHYMATHFLKGRLSCERVMKINQGTLFRFSLLLIS
ncbi:MAG: response regulator [Nitrospirae bacterium]|nr:response regulator [Magnetococcales bacterium]